MRLIKGNSISAWIPFHLQLFTRKSLKRLLVEAGFTDIRIYGYNPTSWLPMSFAQLRNQKNAMAEYNHSTWFALACYPIGWFATKFGLAEELVGIAAKK